MHAHGVGCEHVRDGWIEALDEDVEGHLALDRLLMVGLIMEGEPDAVLARDRARGVEAIGPLFPVVERLLGPVLEVRDGALLLSQCLCDFEAALPAHENRVSRHVTGGRAQTFIFERRGHLLRRAAKQIERPEQLDVGVPHRAHLRERAIRVLHHRVAHRVRLEPDAVELLR